MSSVSSSDPIDARVARIESRIADLEKKRDEAKKAIANTGGGCGPTVMLSGIVVAVFLHILAGLILIIIAILLMASLNSSKLALSKQMEEYDKEIASNVDRIAELTLQRSLQSQHGGGVESRLAELQRMHDAGLITPEEFEAKRRAIIDSL